MSDDIGITNVKLITDGSNWGTYRDRMVWYFDSCHWSEHLASATIPQAYIDAGDINGQTPQQRWAAEEASAMNMIASSVPDDVFNRIKSQTSTHAVWNAVTAFYRSRLQMKIYNLEKVLRVAKLEDDEDPRAHLTKLSDFRDRLASMGKTIDDDEFAYILLASLPSSYATIVTTIVLVADITKAAVNPDWVIRLVANEYDQRVSRGKSMNGACEAKRNVECYNCHKVGHYTSDCWAKGGVKEGQRPPRRIDYPNNDNRNNRGHNENSNNNRNGRGNTNDRRNNNFNNHNSNTTSADIKPWTARGPLDDDSW